MTLHNRLISILLREAIVKARRSLVQDFDFFGRGVPAPWHGPWRSEAMEIMKDQESYASPGRTFRGVRNEILRIAAQGGSR